MCVCVCPYLAYLPGVLGPPFECVTTSSVLTAQEAGGSIIEASPRLIVASQCMYLIGRGKECSIAVLVDGEGGRL